MSIFRRAKDRFANRIWAGRKITLRFAADYRIAGFTLPLIERLLLDNDDGETYRCSIAQWTLNERPSLRIYRGELSSLRIDGPLQKAGMSYLPLGGLIEAPGVTAHLNPVEAHQLDGRVQEAIEKTILHWIIEHGLYDQPRQHGRSTAARPTAKLAISTPDGSRIISPNRRLTLYQTEASDPAIAALANPAAPCATVAGKVRTMPDRVALWVRSQGHDATHRTRNLDTHLTHGCIQLFCHFSRVRSECAPQFLRRSDAIPPKFEGAIRTLREAA